MITSVQAGLRKSSTFYSRLAEVGRLLGPNAVAYNLDGWSTNITYLEIGLKPAVFSCLTNAIAPLPIVPESCSNPQKIRQVFKSHFKKNFWLGVADFCE